MTDTSFQMPAAVRRLKEHRYSKKPGHLRPRFDTYPPLAKFCSRQADLNRWLLSDEELVPRSAKWT